jgi:hypothetical protein
MITKVLLPERSMTFNWLPIGTFLFRVIKKIDYYNTAKKPIVNVILNLTKSKIAMYGVSDPNTCLAFRFLKY